MQIHNQLCARSTGPVGPLTTINPDGSPESDSGMVGKNSQGGPHLRLDDSFRGIDGPPIVVICRPK